MTQQLLTQVEFHFVAPDGGPVKNTAVTIQLANGGFDKDVPGVIMPREIIRTTDAVGKVIVPLQPSETVYYVTVEDSESFAALSYKFYVPVLDNPTDIVRLQDIIVDAEMGPISYDQAALLLIQEVKANVLVHRTAAERAAGQSQDAQVEAESARDMALRTMTITSATPPLDPLPNQEWIDSDTLIKYTWLVGTDGLSGVWAEIGTVLAVEMSPTPTDPGTDVPPFDPSKLETIGELSIITTSLLIENEGDAYRIPLSAAGMTATELPVATVLHREDFVVVTQDGIDKRVSLALLADALNKISNNTI
jgi:hypothetical protein